MQVLSGIRKVFVPAPAKVNLFLAVTGKREDGFHELLSVLVKLKLQDLVTLEFNTQPGSTVLLCPGFSELENSQNLAVRMVDFWREKTGNDFGITISIDKQIPIQAGLGGGSSDGVATLLGLNALMQKKLNLNELMEIASQVGSDCPSFLLRDLCIASGRGEHVKELGLESKQNKVSGKKLLLFKPTFGFSTAEIYGSLKSSDFSICKENVISKIAKWEKGEISLSDFMHNDLEGPVFRKFIFIEALFKELKDRFQVKPLVSGSGSSCFVPIPENLDTSPIKDFILESWGHEIFLHETYFA